MSKNSDERLQARWEAQGSKCTYKDKHSYTAMRTQTLEVPGNNSLHEEKSPPKGTKGCEMFGKVQLLLWYGQIYSFLPKTENALTVGDGFESYTN